MNRFLYSLLFILGISQLAFGQSWTQYDANELPDQATPPWEESNTKDLPYSWEIVSDPDNSDNNLLKFTSLADGGGAMWKSSYSETPTAMTAVLRVKLDDATAARVCEMDMHVNGFREQLIISADNSLSFQRSGGSVDLSGTLDVTKWNTFRISIDASSGTAGEVNVYLNENDTPVLTASSTTTTTSNYIRFGDGNSSPTYSAFIDYVYYDVTGAYSPSAFAIPKDYEPAWVEYLANELPDQATPSWSESNTKDLPYSWEIVSDPDHSSNNLLKFTSLEDGGGAMWKSSYSETPKALTAVMRVKLDDASAQRLTEMDMHINGFRDQLIISADNSLSLQRSGGSVDLSGTLDVTEWNTFRITLDASSGASGDVNVYLNEDPTPVLSANTTTTTGSHYIRFGDGNSSPTYSSFIDFVLYDTTGAYSPEIAPIREDLIPRVPIGDWTVYNSNLLPDAATPSWSESNTKDLPYSWEIVADADIPGNNLLKFASLEDGGGAMWKTSDFDPVPAALTSVMRVKLDDSSADRVLEMDMHINGLRDQLIIGADNTLSLQRSGGSVDLSGTLNVSQWNTFRISLDASDGANAVVNIYLNEDPTPVLTATSTTTTGANYIRFGDGNSTPTYSALIDFVAYDGSGAYAPNEAALPIGLIPGDIKEIAYLYSEITDLAEGAAMQDNDPVIRLLNADPNFKVVPIEVNAAADLNSYDLVIVSESLGSGSDILERGDLNGTDQNGLAFYGDLTVPFIYNKTYALKSGKDVVEGSTGEVEEPADLNIAIPAESQSHPIFSGLDFSMSDQIAIYKSLSDDKGAQEGTKNLNPLYGMQISTSGTNLASAAALADKAAETVLINDIPVGTTFGTATSIETKAKMIALAFAYGPMMKNGGDNITDEGLTIWRNAVYYLTGLTPPSQMYRTPPKKVAYVQKAGFTVAEGAAPFNDDPIIQMLQAEGRFVVDVMEVDGDGTGLDVTGYDLIIAQETFGSSDGIWTPTGPLGIRNISAPVIYNKTWALRDGKAVSSAGASVTSVSDLAITVNPDNQSHPLFKGLVFVNDKLTLFNANATQDGSDGVNSIDVLNDLELSSTGTLLGTVDAATSVDNSVVVNHIPAGTKLGTNAEDSLMHDMVALSFNYGVIIKNGGNNMTSAGMTIWRNAAYILTGLTPPVEPVGGAIAENDSTLADLTVDGVSVRDFSPATLEYDVTLPRDYEGLPTVEAFATNPASVVAITDVDELPGSTQVIVTAPAGNTATYTINFEISIYPPTWTIIPDGDDIPTYFDGAVSGDTLVLEDGGFYSYNTARVNGVDIVLMSVPNPITRPVVESKVIEMNGDGPGLVVRGIDFIPYSASADYFVNFDAGMTNGKHLIVDDVNVEGFGRSIIRGNRTEGQTMDTIKFNNFTNKFLPESLDDAGYASFFFDTRGYVGYLELTNSTFSGGHHYFIDMQADTVKNVYIDHCTFDAVNANHDATRALDFVYMANSQAGSKFTFTNNIVTNLAIIGDSVELKTFNIDANVTDVLQNSAHFNNATDDTNDWSTFENYSELDPEYVDVANADFTVQNDAYYSLGTDGGFIGDPRWNKTAASTDAFLSDLTLDGETIEGFDIGTFDYEVLLAPGTTTVPQVGATTRDDKANAVITQAADANGEATVVITAEDVTVVRTYTIDFIVADGPLDATQLSDLTVNGATVEGFGAGIFEYDVVLDPGTTEIPTVAATAVNSESTVTVTQATAVDGTATVQVESAFTNPPANTYTLNFSVAISTDVTVSEITVDGEPIELEAGTTFYTIGVSGTTVPTVTATPTYAGATVQVTQATAIDDGGSDQCAECEAKITVTAEDGETTGSYTVKFIEALGTDATLSDLKVNGTTIAGFDPATTSYTYEHDGLEVPGILATTTDPSAAAVVNYPAALNGATPVNATVVVTAEDGSTKKTYTISITTTATVIAGFENLTDLNVYPNPFVNQINVKSATDFVNVTVYSMSGQQVMSINTSPSKEHRLNVSKLESGIYSVRIQSVDGNVKMFKVVK